MLTSALFVCSFFHAEKQDMYLRGSADLLAAVQFGYQRLRIAEVVENPAKDPAASFSDVSLVVGLPLARCPG